MALFMNQGLNKGLNSWLAHMERRALMRTALLAMVHRATKTCLNTWVAEAERRAAARAKFEAAAFTMRNLPLKKAINSFRAAVAANASLMGWLGTEPITYNAHREGIGPGRWAQDAALAANV